MTLILLSHIHFFFDTCYIPILNSADDIKVGKSKMQVLISSRDKIRNLLRSLAILNDFSSIAVDLQCTN